VNTRGEIHVLLTSLLKDFDDVSDAVRALIDAPPTTAVDGQEKKQGRRKTKELLFHKIQRLRYCITTLWLLTYSSAVEFHLTAIGSLLRARTVDVELDVDEMDERIIGPIADWPSGVSHVTSYHNLSHMYWCQPVFISFMRWLRRRVTIIKSIHLVWTFAAGLSRSYSPPPSISVRCIPIDHPGGQMEDWRHLVAEFATKSYFGTCSAERAIAILLKKFEDLAAENAESFKGSVHCEAYLASIARSEEAPQDLRREFEASRRQLSSPS
jgi:hypothetical protein